MSSNFDQTTSSDIDFGAQYKPAHEVFVVKKDGSKEAFNVQKVICQIRKAFRKFLYPSAFKHLVVGHRTGSKKSLGRTVM